MFGDNQSVVTSSTLPESRLSKRHHALNYHRVREAIAAGISKFYFIPSEYNLADVLTKSLGYQKAMPLLRPVLFWKGETMEAPPQRLEYKEKKEKEEEMKLKSDPFHHSEERGVSPGTGVTTHLAVSRAHGNVNGVPPLSGMDANVEGNEYWIRNVRTMEITPYLGRSHLESRVVTQHHSHMTSRVPGDGQVCINGLIAGYWMGSNP